ncbi:MAG: hypothetical protein ACT4QE_12270 [Anaerolineales bacterium]
MARLYARQSLGDETFAVQHSAGRAMTLAEAIECAQCPVRKPNV